MNKPKFKKNDLAYVIYHNNSTIEYILCRIREVWAKENKHNYHIQLGKEKLEYPPDYQNWWMPTYSENDFISITNYRKLKLEKIKSLNN